MSFYSEIELLIEPLKHTDPRTWQALQDLNRQLQLVVEDIEPLVRQSQLPGGGIVAIDPPTSLGIISTGLTVRFMWNAAPGAAMYEVRKGTSWDSAFFQFRTTNLIADIDPVQTGTHSYLIKSMDSRGAYSIGSTSSSFTANLIPAPQISSSVIDNNVLMNWTVPPSTFNIKHYILDKGGTQVGLATGTFATFFETLAGTYVYGVTAVDVAGNIGIRAAMPVAVNQPPDFSLQDRRVSALNGTKINTYLIAGPKLLCSWVQTTWSAHFLTRSWDQPSDQVAAGYPVYIQPTSTTGSYEEVIDYGIVLNNVIVNVSYNVTQITSSVVNVTVKLATSLNGSTYSGYTPGSSQFFPTFRYLKVLIEFTGDDKSLIEFYNLTFSIDVKRENDGGEINALSTDVGGTTVYFTKPFKDIESITTTTKSTTEPFYAIFIFTDIPNPTFFKVMCFDSSGNRVTRLVDWKVRGIV